MRRTVIAGLFGIHLVALAVPVHALYVYDMCGGTPSEGASLSCPPGDYYLVRPRYSDGTCDDWVCCPKNPGGPSTGYNCEQGVPPTRSTISSTAKKFLGPRAMPKVSTTPGTIKPTLPQTTAPIMRRGVEGEQPGAETPSGQSDTK